MTVILLMIAVVTGSVPVVMSSICRVSAQSTRVLVSAARLIALRDKKIPGRSFTERSLTIMWLIYAKCRVGCLYFTSPFFVQHSFSHSVPEYTLFRNPMTKQYGQKYWGTPFNY